MYHYVASLTVLPVMKETLVRSNKIEIWGQVSLICTYEVVISHIGVWCNFGNTTVEEQYEQHPSST